MGTLEAGRPGATTVPIEKESEAEELGARLHWLVETGKKLTACSGARELCTFLLEEFVQNMGAEGGSLFLRRDDCLECMHTLDTDHVPRSISLPLRPNSVFHIAFTEQRAVLISDIASEREMIRSGWDGYRNGTVLVLPMCEHGGTVVGLISLHGKVGAFTRYDQELALVMASLSSEVLQALEVTNALRESEDRLKTIFDTVSTGIVLIDHDTHIVADANSTALRMIGLPRDGVVGRPCQDFFFAGGALLCHALDLAAGSPGAEAVLLTAEGAHLPILKKVAPATLSPEFQGRF